MGLFLMGKLQDTSIVERIHDVRIPEVHVLQVFLISGSDRDVSCRIGRRRKGVRLQVATT